MCFLKILEAQPCEYKPTNQWAKIEKLKYKYVCLATESLIVDIYVFVYFLIKKIDDGINA